MKEVRSRNNSVFKELKALGRRKTRESTGCFIVEGRRFVAEAGRYPDRMVYLVRSTAYEGEIPASEAGTILLEESLFKEVSDTVHSQGILAVVRKPPEVPFDEDEPVLFLDTLQDPGNLGTIIRSAVAAGVGQIALRRGSVDLYSPKVVRSSAGGIFHMKARTIPEGSDFIETLKAGGYRIFGAAADGARAFDEVVYPRRSLIIIGNEGRGIDPEILKILDERIRIPMVAGTESLNASVAAGIILYEVGRQLKNYL